MKSDPLDLHMAEAERFMAAPEGPGKAACGSVLPEAWGKGEIFGIE